MKKHTKGFGFRLTGFILGCVSLGIAVVGLVFGLIGWQAGKPLK